MISRISLFLIFALITSVGCARGQASQGAGTTDPEVAKMVQGQVDEFVTKAEKSAARAKGELDLLLESLEGAAGRSAAFAKVRDEAKTLQEMYATNAPKQQIEEQLNSLKVASSELPAN